MIVENGGGGGGVEAPVERMRVERTVWKNEKKRMKRDEVDEPAKEEMLVWNEWWRLGVSGVRWE